MKDNHFVLILDYFKHVNDTDRRTYKILFKTDDENINEIKWCKSLKRKKIVITIKTSIQFLDINSIIYTIYSNIFSFGI